MANSDIVGFVKDWDNLPQQAKRDKLVALEAASRTREQVEIPVKEYFIEGCYGREVFIPKDTCLVGDIHLDEWIVLVSRGKIKIVDEEGERTIDATEHPVTFISPAGVKRAGFALEDTWWTMFIATPHTTSDEIRKHHIVTDYNQLENKHNVLGSNSSSCSG